MTNPESQSGLDAKELRNQYRLLQNEANKNKARLADLTSGMLQDGLDKSNRLLADVQRPQEQAADAKYFAGLTGAALEASKKLEGTNNGRTTLDFIMCLKARYVPGADPQGRGKEDPSAFRWSALDQVAAREFMTAPGVNCMFGPMDAQAKVRKAPQRREKRVVAAVVRPDELLAGAPAEADKQETDRIMEEMWIALHACKDEGCPVAELCCNYKSFAQTVENLFTLSFLVRDQRVSLKHDPAMGMRALAVTKKKAGGGAPEEQSQFVMSLTMADWEQLRKVVGPKGCKMLHREHQEEHEAALQKRRRQN